ncbi:hypothetical protein GO730_01345 [Spirosoma sp. HMF3257]|uniref:YD repeat-containing protein n=1 Tax=Spirosoma telluris TaxID=2183553 RepID=A0A327NGJ5_9BACT|nr:hypothetical protein [Spirosoma telluris]RAI73409.1 hypothetical protein HMF3257_01320 [Spirosoma telluris]
MFNSPVLLKFISLLLITSLLACSDHRIPGLSPSRLRLKTLIQQNGRQLVSEFQYNPQGQLSGIKTLKSDSTQRENSTYTYDSQNRLSQIQRVIQIKFPADPLKIQTESYTFSYTGAGQIAEIRYTNSTAVGLLFVCKPIYDAANQIVGNQVDSYNGYESRQFTSKYIYANSNLTAAHITFSPSSYFDYTFTYDSNINPFYGIILPTGSVDIAPAPNDPITVFVYPAKNQGIANLLSLSRNNVLNDGYNEYIYTYNNVGLPISRSARSPLPDHSVRGTLFFEYESY